MLTIKRLQATKSFGSDLISLRFLKDSLCITDNYLTVIIDISIVTGIFPESWKHALVVPVLKNGVAADVSNNRHISLLPILSKVLQKIVSTQLVNYLEENNLLSKTQHGFRLKLSTAKLSTLTVVTDENYNMDSKKVSLLIQGLRQCKSQDTTWKIRKHCHWQILVRWLPKEKVTISSPK